MESLANIIILMVYLAVGCVGNSIVLYIHRFKMKNTLDNRIYIPCLAVADLISSLMCSMFALYALILFALYALICPMSYTNLPLCKISWYTMTWSTGVAMCILALIAEQRYMKICRPLTKSFFSGRGVKIVVIFYVIAFIIDTPILFMAGISETISGNTTNEVCIRVGGEYRDGPRHQFAIACTVVEMSSVFIVIYFISHFYFKVTSALYQRVSSKIKITKSMCKAVLAADTHAQNISANDENIHVEEITNKNEKREISLKEHSEVKPNLNLGFEQCQIDFSRNVPNDVMTKVNVPALQMETVSNNTLLNVEKAQRATNEDESNGKNIANLKGKLTSSKNVYAKGPTVRLLFKEHRCTVVFILITVVFFVTYVPRVVLLLLETVYVDFWGSFDGHVLQVLIFLNRLHIVNCVVNPLLYGSFDTKFKSEFLKMLKCDKRVNRIRPK